MARYIDADNLTKRLCPYTDFNYTQDMETILKIVSEEPTEDVRPERHGRWKGFPDNAYLGCDKSGNPKFKEVTVWHCSECNRKTVIKETFCPKCGAKMDKI